MTRRLADTAIEQSELYQAAKRDAEEAEAYASELEAKLRDMALDCLAAQGQATENFQMYVDANEARIDAEAKLAKALESQISLRTSEALKIISADAQILRWIAEGYDKEDAALIGEPDPWALDDAGDIGDAETWQAERIGCARSGLIYAIERAIIAELKK
jgi:hypothetical protein